MLNNEHNRVSYQCQPGHKLVTDQCQTNGRDQLLMSTWTQAHNYQCQTNGHNLQLIHLEQGHNYSLAVIKSESLYQLVYLGFICYKLKLIDVVTILTSLSIPHD